MSDEGIIEYEQVPDTVAHEHHDSRMQGQQTTEPLSAEQQQAQAESYLLYMLEKQHRLHQELYEVSRTIQGLLSGRVRILVAPNGGELNPNLPLQRQAEHVAHQPPVQAQQTTAMEVVDDQTLATEMDDVAADGDEDEEDEDDLTEQPPGETSHLWTRAEELRLQRWLRKELSLKEIAKKMPGRSERALRHRAARFETDGLLPQ